MPSMAFLNSTVAELPSRFSAYLLYARMQIGALRGILKLDSSRATVTLFSVPPVRSHADWGPPWHFETRQ